MTNPFAPAVPAQEQQAPQQPPAPAGNPFAAPQQQAAPAVQQPQQNPYGQQAPQAYAGPQQGAPMGYPNQPMQQTYTGQAAPPALDASRLGAAPPPPPDGGKGAKLDQMYGRLVLAFPLSFEQRPKNPKFITDADRASGNLMQDQITATVVVLDDGRGGFSPIAWGGNPSMNQPHTDQAPLPYVRKAMWISQSKLIAQLRPNLPQQPSGVPGMVLGRVAKTGPEQTAAWFLQPATDADLQLARTYLNLVGSGQYEHPLA